MDRQDARTTGIARRIALAAAAGLALATAGLVALPDRAEAVTCPPGTVQLGILCIRGSTPTAPQPTTTTTTAPPVTLPPVTVPPVVTAPPPAPAVSAADGARKLLELANGERAKAGLGALAWRDDVAAIALAHSERMAAAGDIFHSDSFFSASVKNLLNVVSRGENVAYNGSIEGAHTRLMASSGHRANILDGKFSAVGIGVVRHADGRYFITQDFIQPAGAPRSAAPRPAAAPAAPKPAAPKATAPKPAPTTAAPTTAPPTTAPATPTTEAPAPVVPDDAATLSLASAAPEVLTAVPAASTRIGLPAIAAAVLVVIALLALGVWFVPRQFRS